MTNESEIFKEAQKRVRDKAKFYKHLYIYVIVNGVLVLLSLFRGRPFSTFPIALFWGIGLCSHYLKVFGFPGSGILSKEWEDREVRREMDRMQGRKNKDRDDDSKPLDLPELRKNYDESELV
jgi:2TM domain-containing protein